MTNTIFGNTKITRTGNGNGRLTFVVAGTFDGVIVSQVTRILEGTENNLDVNWNESGVKNLPAGKRLLDLASIISYTGGAADDTITVTSEYSVVASVPEPSSVLGILALGTLGAASTLKRKLKPSKSSEKETTKVS